MAFTPTPDPTDEEFLDALPLVDGRIFVAQNELVRRLKVNMPAKIEALNAKLGRTTTNGIVKPQGYYIAPAILTDEYINSIIVSCAVSTEALAPGVFKNEAQVVVYSIDERIEQVEQISDAFDRSGAIRGVLYHFLTGCVDLQGRSAWRLLEPTGVSFLPVEYSEGQYSGIACSYRLVQDPSKDNWI